MSRATPVAKEQLYESEWWTRLAAISEKREQAIPMKAPRPERPGILKMLESLLPDEQSSGLISLFVKSN